MAGAAIGFGPFVVDPARGTLTRGGAAVPLGQRALALLVALAEAPGHTVSKDELIARAWPGVIVEEGNLTVQIAALRRALGETPDGQSWILTVPRVGYRLLSAAPPSGAERDAPLPTLAVLPFANLGGNAEQDWFADGVVDDMITALSRFRSFAVIAGSVSSTYKGRSDLRQVAAELGVRYLLQGSARRAGDRLRISAQLVDGVSGQHLWAQSFEGVLSDVFEFQDRITGSVAPLVEPMIEAAEIERSRRERPKGFASYDVYLQALAGIASETEANNAAAYALLAGRLAQDPDNAQLLSLAAWALEHRHTTGWPPLTEDDVTTCAELADRGLAHAAGDAMVMAHCGIALLQTVKDYDRGMAVLQAAAEANPNNLMVIVRAGVAQVHCGDLDAAVALFRQANRLSPGDRGAHFSLCGMAHVHLVRGEYAEAAAWATRALASNPSFDPALWMLIAADAHLGRMDAARLALDRLRRLSPSATVAGIAAGQPARDPARFSAVLDGLRLAGLPEA